MQREFYCEVHTASSAMDALNLVERFRFAVVLTDMLMPFMDGFEFVAALRKRARSSNERLFICAVTTLVVDKDKQSDVYRDVDVVATKPFDPNLLGLLSSFDILSETGACSALQRRIKEAK